MLNLNIIDYQAVVIFWLAFTRWLTVIFQIPVFDNESIPSIVKILFSLVITYAFYPFVQGEIAKDIAYLGIENFWAITIFYVLIGLVIGYLVKALMNIFIAAGSIITQQVGFAAVSYFDPSTAQQIGPFEKLIQWTMIIMIISSGALIPMFRGIFTSFFTLHLQDISRLSQSPMFFLDVFKGIFLAAIMLASPMIFTNMLIMAVLGILARTVPQMNVIMVSFVVNIGLGLLVFAASSDEFFHMAFKTYTEKLGNWFQFII